MNLYWIASHCTGAENNLTNKSRRRYCDLIVSRTNPASQLEINAGLPIDIGLQRELPSCLGKRLELTITLGHCKGDRRIHDWLTQSIHEFNNERLRESGSDNTGLITPGNYDNALLVGRLLENHGYLTNIDIACPVSRCCSN